MADSVTPKRCAIYTRKSSEEGLEQDFNSLDAQREACEAYIVSQKHEGWIALPDQYDDGGFSGGTMERPALKRLLADIALGRVDIVVVYKVDRLTRALNDFAKIVDAFDGKGVSFVSVTQQFNTTTSMGRLTLNVLLSFAQFEREVTGERIRDKFAASKKKGMWMGGFVPLGYEARDKKLLIVDDEAEVVREIFRLYLELGNAHAVTREVNRRGYRTKWRPERKDKWRGGLPFTNGHTNKILNNPIYTGFIHHKGELFEGLHERIIDRETWQKARAQLSSRSHRNQLRKSAIDPSLLTGRIFDADGITITPTHTKRRNKRYRYYASRDIIQHGIKERGWRIPAGEIEGAVKRSLTALLNDEGRLSTELSLTGASETRAALAIAAKLSQTIDRQRLIDLDVLVTVKEDGLNLTIDRVKLSEAVGLVAEVEPGSDDRIVFEVPLEVRRRGVEMKLVIGAGDVNLVDPTLVKTIARGRQWFEEVLNRTVSSASEIARREGVTMRYVTQHIDLAFLSPTIVEAILQGQQPVEMTAQSLKLTELPTEWGAQAKALGFD